MAVISVSIKPGATTLLLIFLEPNSNATDLDSFFSIFQLEGAQNKRQSWLNLPFSFYFFVKSPNLPFCHIFKMNFDCDSEGILNKGEHFQLSVFHADFKYAVKNGILVT